MGGYLGFRRAGAIIIETTLLVGSCFAAFMIRFEAWPHSRPDGNLILLKAILIALIFQLFLYLKEVYDFSKIRAANEFVLRLGEALLMASGLLWILYYMFPQIEVGRGVFAINLILTSAFLVSWHTLLRFYVGSRTPHSKMLVLGTGRLARTLVQEVLNRPELGFQVQGFVDDDPALLGVSIVNPKVIGLPADLPNIVSERKVDRIVVELQDRRGRLPSDELLRFKTKGIGIEDATSFYERVTGKIAIENLKPSWLIFNTGFCVSKRQLVQKQIAEFIMSLVLLAVLSPVILLAMILIKLDSRGPIFLRQERVGQDGRRFTLWKFRSMREDAESATGPVWATGKNDERITRVGKILRRTRLDEVPQLFSVLRGEMSLVGPRPERPAFVKDLSTNIPFYQLRHCVKPGVTGWAQINYGYANTVENTIEKLQYDLFYIKNMSLQLDSLIVLETVKTVLCMRGV